MIIDRCPPCLQAFFRPVDGWLSGAGGRHLRLIVLAIALSSTGAKLAHLASTILKGRHRTCLGDFLAKADWDETKILANRAMWLLRRMKPRRGEALELLIDDTRIAKRGKKMACLQKIWDHKHQRFVRGHIVIVAALRFRGVVIPWRIVLWKPKACAGREYRKQTEVAAAFIEGLRAPSGLRVRVLFDAFYLCPAVTKACEGQGFTWFSVAARNRVFTRAGGRRGSIGQRAGGWLRHLGKSVKMPRSRGYAPMRLAKVTGRLSRIGSVALVISKRPRDPWRNTVAFATNETGLGARTIVSTYEHRWDIEVMFKELRNDLGLCDYQVMSEQAIVRHLHLCGLAHQLLTHHAMEGVGAQARKANQEVPLPPLSQRLASLRALVRRDQIRRLLKGKKHRRTRMKIEPYLIAA